MSLTLTERLVNEVTVLDLSGRITLGEGSVMLREKVMELLAAGRKMILLNLADVQQVDSSGLGELVSAYTSLKSNGGKFKLVNLQIDVYNLLQLTRVFPLFDAREDEDSAIASFSS
jgi:anti-sigma B factor antagonist